MRIVSKSSSLGTMCFELMASGLLVFLLWGCDAAKDVPSADAPDAKQAEVSQPKPTPAYQEPQLAPGVRELASTVSLVENALADADTTGLVVLMKDLEKGVGDVIAKQPPEKQQQLQDVLVATHDTVTSVTAHPEGSDAMILDLRDRYISRLKALR